MLNSLDIDSSFAHLLASKKKYKNNANMENTGETVPKAKNKNHSLQDDNNTFTPRFDSKATLKNKNGQNSLSQPRTE